MLIIQVLLSTNSKNCNEGIKTIYFIAFNPLLCSLLFRKFAKNFLCMRSGLPVKNASFKMNYLFIFRDVVYLK